MSKAKLSNRAKKYINRMKSQATFEKVGQIERSETLKETKQAMRDIITNLNGLLKEDGYYIEANELIDCIETWFNIAIDS